MCLSLRVDGNMVVVHPHPGLYVRGTEPTVGRLSRPLHGGAAVVAGLVAEDFARLVEADGVAGVEGVDAGGVSAYLSKQT